MNERLLGIHHVTAIAGDPQKNIDFYVSVLGLRLVKKTVNFDAPDTYHFYFGDEVGRPGTLLTFFPWSEQAHRGRRGSGQLTVYSFSIPAIALNYWTARLTKLNVQHSGPVDRFGELVISAIDHDGFQFELITTIDDRRSGWNGIIPSEYAIKGFHSVTLTELAVEPTGEFLTKTLGFRHAGTSDNRTRFETGNGGAGAYVDILHRPDVTYGYMGVGVVHHVAFRAPDDKSQLAIREELLASDIGVTPVIDRNYFHSIYFNEPGGVIFEVATDPPGFLIDEQKEELGTHLMLPPQYEQYRPQLEQALTPVALPQVNELKTS